MSYQEDVKLAEKEVSEQLDKINNLVSQKEDLEKIKAEYGVYIKKQSALYKIFLKQVEGRPDKQKIITDRYRQELMEIAALIDRALDLD